MFGFNVGEKQGYASRAECGPRLRSAHSKQLAISNFVLFSGFEDLAID